MDYSPFYHSWLNIPVEPESEPGYYEMLGLESLEKDSDKIATAAALQFAQLEQVDIAQNAIPYRHILERLLEAKITLTTPYLKREYDTSITGEVYYDHTLYEYVPPTLFTRFRQWSVIVVAFALGCCVAGYMGTTVERNPDGSIIFDTKANIAKKVEPFTKAPGTKIPRPRIQKTPRTIAAVDKPEHPAEISAEPAAESAATLPTELPTLKDPNAETPAAEATAEVNPAVETPETAEAPKTAEEASGDDDPQVRTTPGIRRSSGSRRVSPLYNSVKKIIAEEEAPQGEAPKGETTEEAPQGEAPKGETTEEAPPGEAPQNAEAPKEPVDMPAVTESGKVVEPKAELTQVAMEALKPRVSQAKTLEERQRLAEQLRAESADNLTKDVACYAAYRTALELALQTKNLPLAFSVLDSLDKDYEVSLLAEKLAATHRVIQALSAPEMVSKDKQPIADLANCSWKLCAEMINNTNRMYDEASRLCQQINKICVDNYVAKEIRQKTLERAKHTEQLAEFYTRYQAALETLKGEPQNTEANKLVALWLCQVERDFSAAIPYFAKSDEKPLSTIAAEDLQLREKGGNVLPLADRWWDLAHRLPAPINNFVYDHAAELYRTVDQAELNHGDQIRIAERVEKRQK